MSLKGLSLVWQASCGPNRLTHEAASVLCLHDVCQMDAFTSVLLLLDLEISAQLLIARVRVNDHDKVERFTYGRPRLTIKVIVIALLLLGVVFLTIALSELPFNVCRCVVFRWYLLQLA